MKNKLLKRIISLFLIFTLLSPTMISFADTPEVTVITDEEYRIVNGTEIGLNDSGLYRVRFVRNITKTIYDTKPSGSYTVIPSHYITSTEQYIVKDGYYETKNRTELRSVQRSRTVYDTEKYYVTESYEAVVGYEQKVIGTKTETTTTKQLVQVLVKAESREKVWYTTAGKYETQYSYGPDGDIIIKRVWVPGVRTYYWKTIPAEYKFEFQNVTTTKQVPVYGNDLTKPIYQTKTRTVEKTRQVPRTEYYWTTEQVTVPYQVYHAPEYGTRNVQVLVPEKYQTEVTGSWTLDAGSAVKAQTTTIWAPNGQTETGYLIDGKTYHADGQRMKANYIVAAGGTYYRMDSDGTGSPLSKFDPATYEKSNGYFMTAGSYSEQQEMMRLEIVTASKARLLEMKVLAQRYGFVITQEIDARLAELEAIDKINNDNIQRIKSIQNNLKELGYLPNNFLVNGIEDEATKEAMGRFVYDKRKFDLTKEIDSSFEVSIVDPGILPTDLGIRLASTSVSGLGMPNDYSNVTNVEFQTYLKTLGYYKGSLDGAIGTYSETAIRNFARDYNVDVANLSGDAMLEAAKAKIIEIISLYPNGIFDGVKLPIIETFQENLNIIMKSSIGEDGYHGDNTRSLLHQFQTKYNIPLTKYPDKITYDKIDQLMTPVMKQMIEVLQNYIKVAFPNVINTIVSGVLGNEEINAIGEYVFSNKEFLTYIEASLKQEIEEEKMVDQIPDSNEGTGETELDLRTPLKLGSESPMVIKLQRRLNELGYPNSETGTFNVETEEALKDFQKSFGVPTYFSVDGIAGPQTLAALFNEKPEAGLTEASLFNSNDVAKVKTLLSELGFDIGDDRLNDATNAADFVNGAKTISPMVYASIYLFKHLNGMEVDGMINQNLISQLESAKQDNIDYSFLKNKEQLLNKIGTLDPLPSDSVNGFIDKKMLTVFPAKDGKLAWASRNTCVAWAAFVYEASKWSPKAETQNNEVPEADDRPHLDLYRFKVSGENEAYRPFEIQAEYYLSLGYPKAAYPGQSNHGLSNAIDLHLNSGQYFAENAEAQFAEDYVSDFGFNHLYKGKTSWSTSNKDDAEIVNDKLKYAEVWHKNFVGLQ